MKQKTKYSVCLTLLLLLLFCLNISVFADEIEPDHSSAEAEYQTANDNNDESDKQIIIIGDSYAIGYTPTDENLESWAEQVADKVGITDSILVSANGVGFVKSVEGISFTSLLNTALEQVVDPANVSDVIVCGGYNDQYYDSSTILSFCRFCDSSTESEYKTAGKHCFVGNRGNRNCCIYNFRYSLHKCILRFSTAVDAFPSGSRALATAAAVF